MKWKQKNLKRKLIDLDTSVFVSVVFPFLSHVTWYVSTNSLWSKSLQCTNKTVCIPSLNRRSIRQKVDFRENRSIDTETEISVNRKILIPLTETKTETNKLRKTETKRKWKKNSEKQNWNWKIFRNLNHFNHTVSATLPPQWCDVVKVELLCTCLCCDVSAQSQGLLCEVPRSAKDDNVKYIGYCTYHYKKMVPVTLSLYYSTACWNVLVDIQSHLCVSQRHCLECYENTLMHVCQQSSHSVNLVINIHCS